MPIVGRFAKFDTRKYRRWPQQTSFILASVRAVVRTHAEMIQQHIQRSMQQPKSGVWYHDQPRRSSAPFESPAVQTGKLFRSIRVKQRNWLSMEVGSFNVPYAEFLEFGTSIMKPRPFLEPAVDAIETRFILAMRQLISRL